MSLSGALSNALSGLNANAIGTSVISANIANALNENYGRRTTHLGVDTAQSSGGVRVTNVTRFYDPTLVHQKSSASAEQGNSQVFAKASAELERLWGSVDTNGSVARKLTRFETSLMSAASDPSSNVRLGSVSDAAQTFANALNTTSHGIQLLRSNADAAITKTVESLNTGLARLEGLNQKIVLGNHLGQDTLSLQDQRNATLETISNFIPLHTVERDSGEIAVFSSLGRTLLDGRAVEFSFSPTSTIVPGMTLENGQLSRLSIDGKTIDAGGNGTLAGGTLSAHFDVRDKGAVTAQSHIDAIARDVVDRFSFGGPDTTLGASDAGVFTDAGSAFDPANETGLSGRISLNTVLTGEANELWRWRDGVNAVVQGPVGRADLLSSLRSQITTALTPASSSLDATSTSLVEHIQRMSADVAAGRVSTEERLEYASEQFSNAREAVASYGVNSDSELQDLVQLEKAYAANARVVQVVDDMLAELLNI